MNAIKTAFFCATFALLTAPSLAQDAWWSLEGDFQNATDEVQISFELISPVSSADAFWLRTFSNSGGTNAVGDPIGAAGFDPVVALYDVSGGGEVPRGLNDDGGTPLDAWLTWPGTTSGGAINADPLSMGEYRADLTAFVAGYPGGRSPWALDVYGPWFPITLTGLSTSGGATIRSLKFGGDLGGGAYLNLTPSTSARVTDEFVVGAGGEGQFLLVADTTLDTPGTTSVGHDGQGFATVVGLDAQWEAGPITVGGQLGGSGSVLVTDQGDINSGDVQIGTDSADGTVLIDGTASTGGLITPARWDVFGSITVGSTGSGAGTVTIENSGAMTATHDVGVSGTISAAASVTVQEAGALRVDGTITVGPYGTVSLLRSTQTEAGIETHSFTVDPGGTFDHQDGILTVDGGIFDPGLGDYVVAGGSGGDVPQIVLTNGAAGTVNGDLTVGLDYDGEVGVEEGSTLTVGSIFISYNTATQSNGTVSVRGHGSRLIITDPPSGFSSLEVGVNGFGTLWIADGGRVEVQQGDVSLACCFSSVGQGRGEIVVEGLDSRLDAQHFRFHSAGADSFVRIRDGGVVSANDGAAINFIWPASSPDIEVEVRGAGSLLDLAGKIRIRGDASGGNAVLNVLEGGTVHTGDAMEIFGHLTGFASVLVDATGGMPTSLEVDDSLFIGGNSSSPWDTAQLTVKNGGAVHVVNTLKLWPAGTAELLGGEIHTGSFVNELGGTFIHEDGMLTVDGGQFLMVQGNPLVAFDIDSGAGAGTPIVRLENGAQGSLIAAGFDAFLSVGPEGRGRLEIVGSSHLVNAVGQVGRSDVTFPGTGHGEVLVQGTDSIWELTADGSWYYGLHVGANGHGTLEIRDGAKVIVRQSSAGIGPVYYTLGAGQGIVTVDGPDSLLRVEHDVAYQDSGYLGVGAGNQSGEGSLTISNDGRVEVGKQLWVADVGTVTLSGGQIHAGSVFIQGTLTGEGQIGVETAVNNAGGTVAPGNSTGELLITGNYDQGSVGTLEIELGGLLPGDQYDVLVVDGEVLLDGLLDVSLVDPFGGSNTFEPAVGDAFQILTVVGGLRQGTFATLPGDLPPLPAGREWDILYGPDFVMLEVLSAILPGDYNQNGVVDAADYTVWRDNLGSGTALPNDDTPGVDTGDYTRWKTHFGESAGAGAGSLAPGSAGSSSEPVPEPASRAVIVVAVLLFVALQRTFADRRFRESRETMRDPAGTGR